MLAVLQWYRHRSSSWAFPCRRFQTGNHAAPRPTGRESFAGLTAAPTCIIYTVFAESLKLYSQNRQRTISGLHKVQSKILCNTTNPSYSGPAFVFLACGTFCCCTVFIIYLCFVHGIHSPLYLSLFSRLFDFSTVRPELFMVIRLFIPCSMARLDVIFPAFMYLFPIMMDNFCRPAPFSPSECIPGIRFHFNTF